MSKSSMSIKISRARNDMQKSARKQLCWSCGNGCDSYSLVDQGRAYCSICGAAKREKDKVIKEMRRTAQAHLMIEKMYEIFYRQGIDVYECKDALEAVAEVELAKSRFDSAPEMAVAVMLVHNETKIETRKKINSLRVDFFLPAYDCIVEVDGDRHTSVEKEVFRDNEIRNALFGKCRILHIDTEYIYSNLINLFANMIYGMSKYDEVMKQSNGNPSFEKLEDLVRMRDVWNNK